MPRAADSTSSVACALSSAARASNAVRTDAVLLDSLAVLDDVWRTATESLHATGADALRTRQVAAMAAMGR